MARGAAPQVVGPRRMPQRVNQRNNCGLLSPGMAAVARRSMMAHLFHAASAALVVAALAACGRATPDTSPTTREPVRETTLHSERIGAVSSPREAPSLPPSVVLQKDQGAEPWPVEVMQDPDPRVRRYALEQWARNPTESLDLVTAAMTDPEESIRERAEQLFDDALARKR